MQIVTGRKSACYERFSNFIRGLDNKKRAEWINLLREVDDTGIYIYPNKLWENISDFSNEQLSRMLDVIKGSPRTLNADTLRTIMKCEKSEDRIALIQFMNTKRRYTGDYYSQNWLYNRLNIPPEQLLRIPDIAKASERELNSDDASVIAGIMTKMGRNALIKFMNQRNEDGTYKYGDGFLYQNYHNLKPDQLMRVPELERLITRKYVGGSIRIISRYSKPGDRQKLANDFVMKESNGKGCAFEAPDIGDKEYRYSYDMLSSCSYLVPKDMLPNLPEILEDIAQSSDRKLHQLTAVVISNFIDKKDRTILLDFINEKNEKGEYLRSPGALNDYFLDLLSYNFNISSEQYLRIPEIVRASERKLNSKEVLIVSQYKNKELRDNLIKILNQKDENGKYVYVIDDFSHKVGYAEYGLSYKKLLTILDAIKTSERCLDESSRNFLNKVDNPNDVKFLVELINEKDKSGNYKNKENLLCFIPTNIKKEDTPEIIELIRKWHKDGKNIADELYQYF